MMADVTNLNRFRKQKARVERRETADANAAKFGRTREQRLREEAEAEKQRLTLDAHRRETP